jgi:hypothetical protein
MKSENGRMKGDSNSKDEKMRAENGRISGDSVLAGAAGRSKILRARPIEAFDAVPAARRKLKDSLKVPHPSVTEAMTRS